MGAGWWGGNCEVLIHHLARTSLEGQMSSKQLINADSQGILIGGSDGVTLPLFGSHIDRCAANGLTGAGSGRDKFCQTEIAQHKIRNMTVAPATNEKILRFNILVNNSLIMCMLQGVGGLQKNLDNLLWSERL